MTLLDNLSLRLKLFLAPGVCLVLLVLSVAGSLWGFMQQRDALETLKQDRLDSYRFVAEYESSLKDMNALIMRSLGYSAMGYSDKETAVYDEALLRLAKSLKAKLDDRLKLSLPVAEAESLRKIQVLHTNYDKAVGVTLEMKPMGAAMAANFLTTAQAEFEKLIKEASALSALKLREADQDVVAAGRAAGVMATTVGVLTVIAVLAATGLSLLIAAGLLRRVLGLTQAAEALASGDLTVQIPQQGRDEIGRLTHTMSVVRARLAESLTTVRAASESVRVAANEIAAGNSDLSHRTEQQAASLQQTAASLRQLSEAVQSNADAATRASDLASAASGVALQGGQVVDDVVVTMTDISGASRRIADIVGTIDGIAFQTNILALNAAVEAARAGEQGRGFAVVASEVRTLAQRSAAAAREIKTMIGDSVDKVERGSALVSQAGNTMREIVGQVNLVTGLITEISAAAVEQRDGIRAVDQAMGRLDGVTQQNAAVVEQSAAAADSLRMQADQLSQAMGLFRLEGTRG